MRTAILVCLVSCISQAQTGVWSDQGSGTILKGSAHAAGLSNLVDCTGSTPPAYCVPYAANFAFAGSEQYVFAQGGGAPDTVHNHMYFPGCGGHTDYYGNQSYDYDIAAKTITRLTAPGAVVNLNFVQYEQDGTPSSVHCEQGIVYMPNEDAVFRWGIGAGASAGAQQFIWWENNPRTTPTWTAKYAAPDMHPFLMVSGGTGCTANSVQTGTFTNGSGTGATFTVWINGSGIPTGYGAATTFGSGYGVTLPTQATVSTCAGTVTVSGGSVAGGQVYNGSGGVGSACMLDTYVTSPESILCIEYASNQMYRYTPSIDTGAYGSNPWTTLTSSSQTQVPIGSVCRINPSLGIMFCVGTGISGGPAGGMWQIPLTGGGAFQSTNVTSMTTGCSALNAAPNPGFDYDSTLNTMVGYVGGGNSVVLFNGATLTCTTQTVSGGPTGPAYVAPAGNYDRTWYYPSLGYHIFINNSEFDAFSFTFGSAPTITTSSLSNGVVGNSYAATISTTGSPAPTCSVTAGSLPTGLSLSSGCAMSGTPTKMQVAKFTVTATNGNAPDATQAYTLQITGIGTHGLGGSTLTCIDRDADGYGTGPLALAQISADLTIAGIPGETTPSAPTVTVVGTTGTTTFWYFIESCERPSDVVVCTIPGSGGNVTNAHNGSFSGSNYDQVQWTDVGATYYTIFRAATSTVPSITGTSPIGGLVTASVACVAGTCTFNDTDVLQRTVAAIPGASVYVTSSAHPFTTADIGRVVTTVAGANFTIQPDFTIFSISAGNIAGVSDTLGHILGPTGASGGTWRIDGCLGPDADDQDNTVQGWPQAKVLYGSFSAFLARPDGPGYNPTHIWYLAPASPTAACLANLSAGEPSSSCTGNDSTGAEDDPTHPYANWTTITGSVVAGHMVAMRDGFGQHFVMGSSGTMGSPIIFYAYPGEQPVFDSQGSSQIMNAAGHSWVVLDGYRGQNGACVNAGDNNYTENPHSFHDNIFRHIEGVNCFQGIGPVAGANNFVIEDSTFHNNNVGSEQAGIYVGGTYNYASGITIQRTLAYNNAWNGIHTNAQNLGTIITQCISYNNGIAGISLQSGSSNGFITDNLVFGNVSEPFQIFSYQNNLVAPSTGWTVTNATWSGSVATVTVMETNTMVTGETPYIVGISPTGYNCLPVGCKITAVSGQTFSYALASNPGAYSSGGTAGLGVGDQTGNLIANNTFATINSESPIRTDSNDENNPPNPTIVNLGGNTYKNNLQVNNGAETSGSKRGAFYFQNTQAGYNSLLSSTLDHNLAYNLAPSGNTTIMQLSLPSTVWGYDTSGNPTNGGPSLSWTTGGITNQVFINPLFTAFSAAFTLPSQYNFNLQSGSPAIHAGTSSGAPTYDLYGNAFSATPSLGAIEFFGSSGAGGSVTSGSVKISGGVRTN